jgi:hypothetical protein
MGIGDREQFLVEPEAGEIANVQRSIVICHIRQRESTLDDE